MKSTTIDRTKLMTVSNYAKSVGVERQTVYNWIKSGDVEIELIDSVTFIKTR